MIVSKRKQNCEKNYPKIKNSYTETRCTEVIKPMIEDKTISKISFVCGLKLGGPVNTETDLEFAKRVHDWISLKKSLMS